jgi:hypothetical protein
MRLVYCVLQATKIFKLLRGSLLRLPVRVLLVGINADDPGIIPRIKIISGARRQKVMARACSAVRAEPLEGDVMATALQRDTTV